MNTNTVRRLSASRNSFVSARAGYATAKSQKTLAQFSGVDEAIAVMRPADPMHCLHPHALADSAAQFLRGFPGHAFYAVKVNPDPYVLKRLIDAGIRHFDVASLGEVKLVRGMFPNASLAFMHPVKGREAIRESYFDHGVRVFVLDSFDELRKILEETRNARDLTLFVRLTMPEGSAFHSMSGKFGASHELAVALIREVDKIAFKTGMTFHVGSQTLDPASYVNAIRMADAVVRESGVALDILDVGGGFPVPGLGMPVLPLAAFFDAIREEINKIQLPSDCQIWCEPGAGLAQTSSTLVIKVLLRKDDMLYVNDGGYGNLSDLCWNKRQNDMRMVRLDEKKKGRVSKNMKPFQLFGATCDTPDFLPGPFMLPENVAEGDWLAVSSLGAYAQTLRTNYNGFFSNAEVEIREPSMGKLVKFPRKK
jgi:ornithine decarboxylase